MLVLVRHFRPLAIILFLQALAIVDQCSAVSSLPLTVVNVPAHAYVQPFVGVTFPADANTVALGVTVQVPLEDCDQSSRWTFQASSPLSPQFNMSIDRRVCAVFIYPANPSSVTTIGTFNVEVRKLWYYNNRASPTSRGAVRLAWNYWFTQSYLVSEATYQHVFYCLPASSSFLPYFDAAATCNLWMQDPTDPTATGATLASLYSANVEWLIQHQRAAYSEQETDIVSGQTIGFVTYIGLFGNRAQWDNGVSVVYKNFETSNPTGNFPTVMDQYGRWKSVVTQETHAYCCESSGIGSTQAAQNGMISALPFDAASSLAPTIRWVMDYTSAQQYPFKFITLSTNSSQVVFGFVASIHPEDCDGSLRFLLDSALSPALAAAGLTISFDVELCTVRLSAASAINGTLMHPFIRQIRLIVIKAGSASTAGLIGYSAPPSRLIYGFTFGDATAWYIANYPLPHFYQCFFASLSFDEADDACAVLAGGLNEAYLLTVQSSWEQSLIERLQSRVAFNDDVWFGLNTLLGTSTCANGDSMNISNWAVNQPSIANSPALVSASDGTWVSSSGTSQHSYCCEWNAIPSRGLSGAMNVTPAVFSLGIAPKQTTSSYKAFQQMKPFRNLSSYVYQNLLNASVLGVTMQLAQEDCLSGTAYQLWAPSGVIPNGFVFCSSASSGCDYQVLRASCMWYLRTQNGSSVAASSILSIMGGLVLNMTNRIGYTVDVPVGWAFWGNASLALGPIVLHATAGSQFVCADPTVRVTYLGAMEQCRFWHGDGYLASVLSADEEQLLQLARRISNGYSVQSFGANAWIGLNRNDSIWANGDPKVFQNWASGQPDKTGPTQAANTGQWTNVAHAQQTTLPTASFCCKRNGFNQLTSIYGGVVHMRGPTYSISLTVTKQATSSPTRSRMSQSDELTKTNSFRETLSQPPTSDTITLSQSTSDELSASHSMWQTTSVPATTQPATSSLSAPPSTSTRTLSTSSTGEPSATRSRSRVVSPSRNSSSGTLTVSIPLPPIARIMLISPLALVFSASQVRAGTIFIAFECVFAHFQPSTNNVFSNGGIRLTLSLDSPSRNVTGQYFDYSNVGGLFLSQASFTIDDATRTHLVVQLLPVAAYDTLFDEYLTLTINKNVTDVPENFPPVSFPPFAIRIMAENTDATVTAKVFSTILGALALAAPAAFRDQQVLYLLGRHYCAKPYMRSVFMSGQRVVSPAAWEDSYFSDWVGAAVVVGAIVIGNILLLARATCTPPTSASIFSRALFPSIAVLGIMWMHVSVTFFSLRLVQENVDSNDPNQSMVQLGLGGFGVCFSGLATLAVLLWSWMASSTMKFENYDEPALHRVDHLMRVFLPFGRWASVVDRTGLYWIAGEFRYVQYAGAEWLFGWLFTWFISYRPDSKGDCYSLFIILGLCALLLALIVAAVRPFRSWFLNLCSALSLLCLCIILCLCAPQIRDPDGSSQRALLAFRWILIVLTDARSVGNILFLHLEARLIATELDSYEKERWRQMHALKKNSSHFQAQWLQKAHDEADEVRKQEQLMKEMESLRRFHSIAYDGDDVPPPMRDPTILDPGYRFPQSFRKSDASAIVNMDFPDDEALPQPPLPRRELSFGSIRSPGMNQRSLSRAFSQHKKFSIQYVESDDDDSASDDSSGSSELYDPFASSSSPAAARPQQGMYKNSLLYRDESHKPSSNSRQQSFASPSSFLSPRSGGRGPSRVSFVDARRLSSGTYDPFGDVQPTSPRGGGGSPRRREDMLAAQEDAQRRLSRSKWDSTVRQMMQQRDSVLSLDHDSDL